MLLAADYPFLDIFWTMIIFFAWVIWIWTVIRVLSDVFRRHDIGGWHKAFWVGAIILLPFLGVLIYLISQGREMAARDLEAAQAARAQLDDYVKSVAGGGGGAAAEIDQAKKLLDAGTISQAEFEAIKAKAVS